MRTDYKSTTYISFLPNEYDNPFANEEIEELHKFLRNPLLNSLNLQDDLSKHYNQLFQKHLKSLLGKEVNKNTIFIIPFEWNYESRNFLKQNLLEIGLETTYTIISDVVLIGVMLHSSEELKNGRVTYLYGKKGIKGLYVQFLKEGNVLRILAVYRRNNPVKIYFQKNVDTQLFLWGNAVSSELEAQNKSFNLLDAFSIGKVSYFLEESNVLIRYKTTPSLCFRKDVYDKKIIIDSSFPLYIPFSFQVKEVSSDNFYLELYGAFCDDMDLLELARLEIQYGSGLGRIDSKDEFIINVILEIVDGRNSIFSARYVDYNGITHEKICFFEIPSVVA
ncbi:MAG: hypothetical protein H7A23_16430 [Leptospiraceae bacterium]|nr:hypothetical protein [Leptospiraceae bacterium]MCP5496135.1 hypothetical protein [Leptospiraceae bacterium]